MPDKATTMRAMALFHLARRLLEHEAADSLDQISLVEASEHVIDKFRLHLFSRIGQEGFRTLLARAPTWTTAQFPHLIAIHLGADGSMTSLHQASGMNSPAEQHNQQEQYQGPSGNHSDGMMAVDGAVSVVAHLFGLLLTFTAELKYALRGFVREDEHPARILTQMNAYLCEGHRLYREGLNTEGDDSPVCLTIILVNTATGQAAAACAGMEPPLLVCHDGQMEEMRVNGLPRGVQTGSEYDEVSFSLGPNDWIILKTDGVTKARQGQNFLGYEGLMRLAQQGRSLGSLQMMGQTILEGARAFVGRVQG